MTEGYKVEPPGAVPEFAYPDQGSGPCAARLYGTDFYSGAGPSRKRQAASVKKYLTKIVNRGTIPYNLKRKENYGLFSIKNTC